MKTNISPIIKKFDKLFNTIWGATDKELVRNWYHKFLIQAEKEIREDIVEKIKRYKNKWKICKRKNCDNKEECERANHYIKTIWNPTFDEIIKP
jgi:hypothetical protein